LEDLADKVEADIPNSDREDSPNMDAKTPNMDRKTTTGVDSPNTDRNIPNMDRDIYMGSRVEKYSNHYRGNNDMDKNAHNLGKKIAVRELDWLPSLKLKA
jgi:hypothetical protein